jgi:Endonuclease NucS C-terminal domain
MLNRLCDRKEGASYFLISVSTGENLELCLRYALAGFPGGENGAWTFSEIDEGDFVSFLYGARAYNLYQVGKKEAVAGAEHLPPWKPLIFAESGKTYAFPYRLQLRPVRTFVESIARTEFLYVAENLLLRGGYRRTHFQADQTTLQSVSQMGVLAETLTPVLQLPTYRTFAPRFTLDRGLTRLPEICHFRETILQSAIRHHLSCESKLQAFLSAVGCGIAAIELEVLGEKALTQGHIDLLLKDRIPVGSSTKIPIEVKTKRGQPRDVEQLQRYMKEIGDECRFGVLVAADFAKRAIEHAALSNISLIRYRIGADLSVGAPFEAVWRSLTLEPV